MVAEQFTARAIDWQPLRSAYIDRAARPTYAELEEEFGVKLSSIGRVANEEGWNLLRAARLERAAKECDALAVMIEGAQVDRTLMREVADYAIISIRGIRSAVESIPDDRAATTKLEAHNTANFAVLNLAKALHEMGIVGLTKVVNGAGKEANGRWNPEMLQQINVTVQNLQAQAETAKVPTPSSEVESLD